MENRKKQTENVIYIYIFFSPPTKLKWIRIASNRMHKKVQEQKEHEMNPNNVKQHDLKWISNNKLSDFQRDSFVYITLRSTATHTPRPFPLTLRTVTARGGGDCLVRCNAVHTGRGANVWGMWLQVFASRHFRSASRASTLRHLAPDSELRIESLSQLLLALSLVA